jgi:hypothetical protein
MSWLRILSTGVLLVTTACGSNRSLYQPTCELEDEPRPPSVVEPSEPRSAERFTSYSDDAADRWLTEQVAKAIDKEIRERDAARQEAEQRVVEEQARSAVMERRVYDRYYGWSEPYRRDRSPAYYFPWNTVTYGGLGAIIGHQSGHRDRGLAVGAGIGLLFDMLRWRY